MIRLCPRCGRESGLTHGDQLWITEICDECLADEEEAEQARFAQADLYKEDKDLTKLKPIW
jgi:hypothetical protein